AGAQQGSDEAVVAFQNHQPAMIVDANKDDRPKVRAGLNARHYGPHFGGKAVLAAALDVGANPVGDVLHAKIPARQSYPVCAGEDAYVVNIGRSQLDLPPLAVLGQLPPHSSATAVEKSAAQSILGVIGEIRVVDDVGKQIAVEVIFLVEKFALEKLGDDFGFGDPAQFFHETASSIGSRARLRAKGITTNTSMTPLRTMRTRMTSRKL